MKTWKLNPSAKHAGWSTLVGPYDEDFINDFKESISGSDRDYLPSAKAWLVRTSLQSEVLELIDAHTELEAPSDFIGLEVCDQHGTSLGKVSGLTGGQPIVERSITFDTVLEDCEKLGAFRTTADVWEVLEFLGVPKSVTVREVDGRLVIVALVQPA